MPKLLLFAPCEKAIVDEVSHTTSLIAIMQEIHYKVAPGAPSPPPNAALPMHWSVVSLWQEEESADAGVEFEQRIVLENNAGAVLLSNEAKFKFDQPNHRIVASIVGFPLGYRKLALNLFYRVPPARDWIRVSTFPLSLQQDVF